MESERWNGEEDLRAYSESFTLYFSVWLGELVIPQLPLFHCMSLNLDTSLPQAVTV